MGLIEDHHWWGFFEVLMHSLPSSLSQGPLFSSCVVWKTPLQNFGMENFASWTGLGGGAKAEGSWWGPCEHHGMSNGVWGMGFLWDEWFAVQCFDFPSHFLPKLSQFKETSSQTLFLPLCLSQWIHVMLMPLSPSLVVLCWGKIWALTYSNKRVIFLLDYFTKLWNTDRISSDDAQGRKCQVTYIVHLLAHFSLCRTTWLEWPFVCSFQLDHMYGEGSWPLESVLSDRLCAEAREVQGGWRLQISVSCGSQFLWFVTVFQC
jgi:hypothetical protein